MAPVTLAWTHKQVALWSICTPAKYWTVCCRCSPQFCNVCSDDIFGLQAYEGSWSVKAKTAGGALNIGTTALTSPSCPWLQPHSFASTHLPHTCSVPCAGHNPQLRLYANTPKERPVLVVFKSKDMKFCGQKDAKVRALVSVSTYMFRSCHGRRNTHNSLSAIALPQKCPCSPFRLLVRES